MPDTRLPTSEPRPDTIHLGYAPRRRGPRLRATLRAWARDTFSRASLLSSFKTLLWVAPLTVLIWVYAEREQLVLLGNQQMTIELRANDATRVIRLISPGTGTIHADLKGPQVEVERVREWLQSRAVPVDMPSDLPQGEHVVPIEGTLNQLGEVKAHGVTVSNCMPAEITIGVDMLGSREIPVEPRPVDAGRLGSTAFTPSRVRVVAPESTFRDADARGQKLIAYAEVFQTKEAAEVGRHSLSAVPLKLSTNADDAHVRLTPVTVSAEIDVRAPEATVTLHGVRVLAAEPELPIAEQYRPVYDQTLPSLTVSGPQEQITRLSADSAAAAAIFEVNYSDPTNPPEAPLIYQLPPGVHVNPEDAQRTIKYTLVRRTPTDQ